MTADSLRKESTTNRREFIQRLGFGTAAALAVGALRSSALTAESVSAVGRVLPVVTINHLSLAAADYAKSRDWYVDLFGMRVVWDNGKMCALEFGSSIQPNGIYIRGVKPNEKPNIGHFAFGTAKFDAQKQAMKAEMERRGLKNIQPDGAMGWTARDPAGYLLNTWVPIKSAAMYPGADAPCADAKSHACKAGWESGRKDLNSIPAASGTGFKATSYSHVVLNVPEADVGKERDFYSAMYGMKVIYDKPSPDPEVFLRFGENTLWLRKTAHAHDKPYCNCYGFVVENYNKESVEAKLRSRGFDPKPNSELAWAIQDPDGMRVEVAGWGFAEQFANNCRHANKNCPDMPRMTE